MCYCKKIHAVNTLWGLHVYVFVWQFQNYWMISRKFSIDECKLKLLVTNFDLYLSSIIAIFYMKFESNLIFSYTAFWTEIGAWYKTWTQLIYSLYLQFLVRWIFNPFLTTIVYIGHKWDFTTRESSYLFLQRMCLAFVRHTA